MLRIDDIHGFAVIEMRECKRADMGSARRGNGQSRTPVPTTARYFDISPAVILEGALLRLCRCFATLEHDSKG